METAGLENEAGDRVRLEAVAVERVDAENGYLCLTYWGGESNYNWGCLIKKARVVLF
jgi:hypothetical protein